jgi:IPT/TIG domain
MQETRKRTIWRQMRAVGVLAAALLVVVSPVLAVPAAAAPPPPVVTSICRVGLAKPQCQMGPTAGGYQVVISGSNLTGATQVSFGGMKASSFTVNSATKITAVIPASTLALWPAQGVSVQVTTPGGTSAGCAVLQAVCAAAFFYANTVSLAGSGSNFTYPFSGSVGLVTYSGTVSIGSWSTSGSAQSSGNAAPEAVLATGTFSVSNVSVHLTVSGGIGTEKDIPLPLPGLPSIADAYLRLVPGLQGKVTMTDTIANDAMNLTIGWVSGVGYHQVTATCNPASCAGNPTLSASVSGTLITGLPWLQIGASQLDVGIGPAAGIYGNTAHVSDACAGIQAEVDVPALGFDNTYNLYGPLNMSGTFAECPLTAS